MAETMATRQAYGKTLIELGEKYPQLVVMDAEPFQVYYDSGIRQDLSGSLL